MSEYSPRPPRRRRLPFLSWANAIAIAFHLSLLTAVSVEEPLNRSLMIGALTACLLGDLYLAHVLNPRGAS